MASTQYFGSRPKLAEMIGQHVIVFLICIVFPGLTTMFAPASWITLERSSGSVRCTTRTCAYFIVPYKTQHVENVTQVTHREKSGRTEKQRQYGRTTDKVVHVDGEGFLQFHGDADKMIEVSVSPASLKNVDSKVDAFMSSTTDGSTTLFVIANWKFGAIMGGVLTCFTALYVVGYSLEILKFILLQFKKMLPPSPEQSNDR